jgi:hypothetical protein
LGPVHVLSPAWSCPTCGYPARTPPPPHTHTHTQLAQNLCPIPPVGWSAWDQLAGTTYSAPRTLRYGLGCERPAAVRSLLTPAVWYGAPVRGWTGVFWVHCRPWPKTPQELPDCDARQDLAAHLSVGECGMCAWEQVGCGDWRSGGLVCTLPQPACAYVWQVGTAVVAPHTGA